MELAPAWLVNEGCEAYESTWPLGPGYPERREIYNLYHLLNHLNLFGAGYTPGVERTLRRYGG